MARGPVRPVSDRLNGIGHLAFNAKPGMFLALARPTFTSKITAKRPEALHLGRSLSYDIRSAAAFVLDLEVARLPELEFLRASPGLTPNLKRDAHATPDLRNRHLGVDVPTGQFALA